MSEPDVIIIGVGAAGLSAANEIDKILKIKLWPNGTLFTVSFILGVTDVQGVTKIPMLATKIEN